MKQIKVTFSRRDVHKEDPRDQIHLFWDLKSTPVSRKYFEALKIACERDHLYRRDRFPNFPNSYDTEERIVAKLNRAIDTINAHHPGLVPERAHPGMTQEYMNHLHVYFEKHRGPMKNPAGIYREGANEFREALDELNLTIHQYEDVIIRKGAGLVPIIHCNFGLNDVVKRYPLADEDFDEFTFEVKFGSWFVSYCEVGKPLHDIWRDRDAEIGHEVVIPLRYYSADGMINFGGGVDAAAARRHTENFHRWWDENKADIEALGFLKHDRKNSLGNIVVAELNRETGAIRGLPDDGIVELLSGYQWLSKVSCLEEAEKDLSL
ncbi:MAG: hypothetical protein KF802_08890 [Bdellovibrionaceae bacterium]|nr:hypothetical protein [Pseudobdellovibrionaceae bacterium]